MKYVYSCLIALIIAGSCKDKAPEVSAIEACGVKDPIHNLDWLKNKIDTAKTNKTDQMLSVVMVTVDGKQIINYRLSYMACIACYGFNCDGSPFDMSKLTEEQLIKYSQETSGVSGNRIVLWPEQKTQ